MGINYETAFFLSSCITNNNLALDKVDFSQTITLGRQFFTLSKYECRKLFNKYFSSNLTRQQKTRFYKKLNKANAHNGSHINYSEPFFELLSKKKAIVDSLDYSDYEDATIIHDITIPISSDLKNKYSCVFDGGLLEHVYNFPTALKNAMNMVTIGGHLILVTPGNNWFGHGFYQFSPELFYSVLREENGFSDTQIFMCNHGKWYLVQNPRLIHRRTEISPKWSNASLYVISKKISETPDNVTTFQSDYEEAWALNMKNDTRTKKQPIESILENIYHRLPLFIRYYLLRVYRKLYYIKNFNELFTFINRDKPNL